MLRQGGRTLEETAWALGVKISTLCEWNKAFDEKMVPLIVPDRRGKGCKITADMVREIVELAKEVTTEGRRIRLKSFTRQLEEEKGFELSSKKVGEVLTANGLYKPEIRNRRPKFYQALRQGIPNGLVSVDGSEFTVWIDQTPYKFNLELCVDVESYYHSGFSVSDSETSREVIKVMEAHKGMWGTPLGVVLDHGRANLSDESSAYFKVNDIEVLPAGPANPKGNGSVEGAFSEMKGVIGTIDLKTVSPRDLARMILEKLVSIYIAMRNRIPRFGDKISPEGRMKAGVPEEPRQALKEKYKGRKRKHEDSDREAKLDRLAWIIRNHGLEVDDRGLKRAQKCIVTYDLNAINKSEEAFLKAVRRDHKRCTLPYFFGILNNIQDDLDIARHEAYCRNRYHYQTMLDREREEKEKAKETITVKGLTTMLANAIILRQRFVRDACVRQAKRMAAELKKEYRYIGALKKRVFDELTKMKNLGLEQRNKVVSLMDLVLS